MPYPNDPTFPTVRAKEHSSTLRAHSTPPEQVLWARIRNRTLGGFKFRRQHPIGVYIADFYCHESKLVVEVDSSYHAGRQEVDVARDAWLNAQSISVLRVSASELAKNEEGVLMEILRVARELLAVRDIDQE